MTKEKRVLEILDAGAMLADCGLSNVTASKIGAMLGCGNTRILYYFETAAMLQLAVARHIVKARIGNASMAHLIIDNHPAVAELSADERKSVLLEIASF